MNEDVRQRIQRILRKLATARKRGLQCFGSDRHKFGLAPPLPETELAGLERAFGVRLPEDFRAFLLMAGGSGAGPSYGIHPPDRWHPFAENLTDNVPVDVLAQTSPLTPGPNEVASAGRDALTSYQGTLVIGTRGCSNETLIIVTGAYRGRIVYANSEWIESPYVVREPDFLSWYERWLDELLAGYDVVDCYGPSGGETEFFKILDEHLSDDVLRGEAARAFSRLPRLTSPGATRVIALLDDPVADVRAGALSAARKFRLAPGLAGAIRLLSDPDPRVRLQAVSAVVQLDPTDSTGSVRDVMRNDADEDVFRTAFFELERSGAIGRPDFLELLRAPGRLHGSAAHALEWQAGDVELATALLDDGDPGARMYAVLAIRKLNATSAAAAVAARLDLPETDYNIGHILKTLGLLGEPAVGDTLLKWTRANDDFHRLEAVLSLIKLGDKRVLEIAREMLNEDRPPSRWTGLSGQSGGRAIGDEVKWTLADSADPAFRALAADLDPTRVQLGRFGQAVERVLRRLVGPK